MVDPLFRHWRGNELNIPQELIANMLGVRREGVTEAPGHLQAAGLIHYSSQDHRAGPSEAGSTSLRVLCGDLKREYDRLLPPARSLV